MNWRVPYFDLRLGEEEKKAVLDVLESNWLTSGPKIQEFEAAFARAVGVPADRAIALSSCTAALHLAALALRLSPGDEVICPSLTFVATANAVRYCGATPVFADIASEADWNVDPDDIARKIGPRTRALFLVHYGGYPCDMDRIMALARKHGLAVVEDACHGPLVRYRDAPLGTIGEIGCFSFFSNKNMTTGEGGIVLARSAEIAERVRVLRSHGMTSSSYQRFRGHAFGYDVTELGYNYRMDEIRAAMGVVQLAKLPATMAARRRCVTYYRQSLRARVPEIAVPFADREGDLGYHVMATLLPAGTDREALMQHLAERGVQTSIHYRPVHTFTSYRAFPALLERTEAIAPRILSLPLFPSMGDEQIDYVVESLRECL